MAKFSFPSDEVEKLAQRVAKELEFGASGIKLVVLNTMKSPQVCKVCKTNEITEIIANESNVIVLIVYERAFDRVDEQTQMMWIRTALSKVSYDFDKDKISIENDDAKNIVNLHKVYKDTVIQNIELGYLTIQQIIDEDQERKNAEKEARAAKKAAKKMTR